MRKIKITYERLFEFVAVAHQWLAKNEPEAKEPADAVYKLGYAILRTLKQCKKPQQKYLARRDEIQIDCCAVDENKRILKDARGNFEFTQAGLKDRNLQWQKLDEVEIEIEHYFAAEIPDNLTFAEREAFDGIVLTDKHDGEGPQAEEAQQTAVQ